MFPTLPDSSWKNIKCVYSVTENSNPKCVYSVTESSNPKCVRSGPFTFQWKSMKVYIITVNFRGRILISPSHHLYSELFALVNSGTTTDIQFLNEENISESPIKYLARSDSMIDVHNLGTISGPLSQLNLGRRVSTSRIISDDAHLFNCFMFHHQFLL